MDDLKKYRPILFAIFITFYVVITVLTILQLFFGIGHVDPQFQPKLFIAFILEVATAVGALFYAVFGLKKDSVQQNMQLNASSVLPAQKEVTEKDIKTAKEEGSEEVFAAPDGSYLIDAPPNDWVRMKTTLNAFRAELHDIKNPDLIQQMGLGRPDISDVVTFTSPRSFTIIPKPGTTTINDSLLFTALDIKVKSQLIIVPMNRYAAPFFQFSSAEKILFDYIVNAGALKLADVKKISSGLIKDTNRKISEVETLQMLRNVIANGDENTNIEIHNHFFAIEGEIKHYILQLCYCVDLGKADTEATERNVLFSLVNSFKPLKALN